jgi:hypothetical protein
MSDETKVKNESAQISLKVKDSVRARMLHTYLHPLMTVGNRRCRYAEP